MTLISKPRNNYFTLFPLSEHNGVRLAFKILRSHRAWLYFMPAMPGLLTGGQVCLWLSKAIVEILSPLTLILRAMLVGRIPRGLPVE